MSAFFEKWEQCMHGHGFPVPNVEDANEAIELLHKLHSAWENAGGEEVMTIGALLATGAIIGIDEAVLMVLEEVAQIAVAIYIGACIGCIASVAIDDLRGLFASNEIPDFVVAELNNQGIDLANEASA